MTGLAGKARAAVIWSFGFNVLRDLLQFATMLVLVRLLAPSSYGEMTLTTSIITFATWISFSNFLSYIIQVQSDEDIHYQDHFTAGGVIQLFAFLLVNLIAICTKQFPVYHPVAPYVHLMSFSLVLNWPAEFRRIMLVRQHHWKRIGILNGIGIFAGAITGPLLALNGAGTYALLIPTLLMPLPFIYDLLIVERWRPTWQWSKESYRPAINFGLIRIAGGATVGVRLLIEATALTLYFGFAGLGVYTRALSLAQMFCSRITSELLASIYPVLTRIGSDDSNTRRIGGMVLRVVLWLAIPIAVTLGTLAPQVVHVVYGSRWVGVTPLLPWALLLAVLSSYTGATYTLLLSRQLPKYSLGIDVFNLIGTVVALWLFSEMGALVYLQALTFFQMVLVLISTCWLFNYHAINSGGLSLAVLPPLLSCAIAWLITYAILQTGTASGDKNLSQIVVKSLFWGGVFSVLYALIIRIFFKSALAQLITYMPASRIFKFFLIMK